MHPLSVRPWRRVVGAGAGVALVFTLGACGSKSPSPSAEPAATSSTTSTSVASTAAPDTSPPDTSTVDTFVATQQAVYEAYLGYWSTWDEASSNPINVDHPGLERYYTGAAFDQTRASLSKMVSEGTAGRPAENSKASHTIRFINLYNDTAFVEDCLVDDGVIYRVASGEIVNDVVKTVLVRATAFRTDGQWKVGETKTLREWQGVSACDG
jgi:hypothetical protein